MNRYVISFHEVDRKKISLVGGKAANLSELCIINGLHVPEGFCITTEAYKKITKDSQQLRSLLLQLRNFKAGEREKISDLSARIRTVIESIPIPFDIAEEIERCLERFDAQTAYAVRSSATAEDLPAASFAGQQDTYLNVIGKQAILTHISKCWASLFTDRAITYRIQNRFDHSRVHLSVIVQRMVFPYASGILFTADPVSSNRRLLSIEASFGLGESLVSGIVSADSYKVYEEQIASKVIATKKIAVYKTEGGGTETKLVAAHQQKTQTLTNEQILELARAGRQIETHFGTPQDIEWCLADDTFYILQSRPITTLYPVPQANDQENHVYVSVGHQQMMTDPIKPLGLSFYLLTTPAPMRKAGGRLFVDVTQMLVSPEKRVMVLDTLGKSDPLIKEALVTIIERGNFIKCLPDDTNRQHPPKSNTSSSSPGPQPQTANDPAIISKLIKRHETAVEALKENILAKSGPELFDFILEDIQQLKQMLFDPQSLGVIMAAMNAFEWINEKMNEWLGEKNVADSLSQSVPNNITSEMGLALLDVADVIRRYPEVINYLRHVKDDNFLNELDKLDGGQESHDAISAYLKKYGMRCAGEIDITKPRWNEKPITLLPMILGNIKNFEADASHHKFEQGLQEALNKAQALLDRLKQLPDGEEKATGTKRMIDLVRNGIGYREYPKYGMVNRYFIYKQALLKEADQLAQSKVIYDQEDIYYLTFEELQEAVKTNKVDYQVITDRKDQYRFYEKLTPPRVITSDGEIITGRYKREDLPPGAIPGLPVSSGVVEGRARIILNMKDADLEDGDILVTSFTDPSWTTLFVSIKGLVTEVGGLMTHGAVIAREYGLPAVVGVEHATNMIRDGQRIRVNGTDGYVALL